MRGTGLTGILALLLLLASALPLRAETAEEELDVTEIIYEHTGDAYAWHHMPLPVIVRSRSTGWHIFLSSALPCEGFAIGAADTPYAGKVVEETEEGPVRPLDLSITRNVLSLLLSSVLLVVLVLLAARWYRRHDVLKEAPKGIAALLEPVIVMLEDEVFKPAIGRDWDRYSSYLLTAFFFILINNLLGILPIFPGGANLTGNIAVTLVLAMCTFLATNLFGTKHYWKDIFWPEVPVFLKVPLPLMPIIEIVGLFTKPFSLMIRLFANIFAGHAMLIGLLCVIFVTAKMGPVINGSMMFVSVLLGIFMDCLEVLVAFIQASVFTMLSAVFIGASRQTNH